MNEFLQGDIVETPDFLFFWHGWPSQWHPSPFEVDGVSYRCAEQFMMAEKARLFGDDPTLAKILAADDPKTHKALGRQVQNFHPKTWTRACRGIVERGNLAKFSQDDTLRQLLLDSHPKRLVEASPYDTIWGIGLRASDPRASNPEQWRGTNWLGLSLEAVRDALR